MADNTQLNTLLKKCLKFNGAIPTENQTFLFEGLLHKRLKNSFELSLKKNLKFRL